MFEDKKTLNSRSCVRFVAPIITVLCLTDNIPTSVKLGTTKPYPHFPSRKFFFYNPWVQLAQKASLHSCGVSVSPAAVIKIARAPSKLPCREKHHKPD